MSCDRAAAATDHEEPERVADSVWTVVAPCLITTLTAAESPVAVPAVPWIVGVAVLIDEPLVGTVTATPVGAAVSTVKLLAALVVECPAASAWLTVTV